MPAARSFARFVAGLVSAGTLLTLLSCGGDDGGGSPTATPTATTSTYAVTNLVSKGTGTPHTDANLVNGWGVAFNPQGFVWVNDAGTSKSTLYDGNGVPQALVVSIPPGSAGAARPTGIVFNGSTDFVVSNGTASGASPFIFAGEAGTLSAWSPTVNRLNAITVFDGATDGASYKGLALAQRAGANFLYAADFHNARVDVFDAAFAKVTVPGGFADPNLPAGYAPFGIQAIGDRIYVAYAQQDAQAADEVKGAGLGVVDVFDTDGRMLARIATGGLLNAPWGMAVAPASFGSVGGRLLVGNFGDGRINAFDTATGQYVGTLSDSTGAPIAIDGLWGIAFGNGLNSQPANTLFFAAGPNDEANGLYGRIDLR